MKRGFTLLEVLVVLVIVGLALSLVLTRGPQRSARLEMSAAARDIASALRVARGAAIAHDRVTTVTIDTAAHVLAADGGPTRALPPDVSLSVTSPVTQGSVGAIRFAPDGGSTGGTIELTGKGQYTTIAIDWLTGRVAIAQAR